jgi:hypothetical protein
VALVSVEQVSGRAAYKRFFEFAYLQFRDEPNWSPPLVAHERVRLDHHRNPFFDEGDGEYFLARRNGVVAGRITAHMRTKGAADGWFGFYDVVDDPAVAVALVDHAATWLRDNGCTTMTGPASFTPEDDPGVLVAGFDSAGTTGRPWHPPWYAAHLETAGLEKIEAHPMWRLAPSELGVIGDATTALTTPSSSGLAGRFADPRIVLPGIVAVPDLTPARGSAVTLARRGKRRQWNGCTIVQIDGDPSALVPQLQAAAGMAGYDWIVSPWSPHPAPPPETVHARFKIAL